MFTLSEDQCRRLEIASRREWLLTNGIGGFASGTASGINTRRYHGLLVAATEPPTVRHVLLASVDAFVHTAAGPLGISCNQYPGAIFPEGYLYLRRFSAGDEVSSIYESTGFRIERRVRMHYGKNAVTLGYTNLGEHPLELTLNPLVSHKFYHSNFTEAPGYPRSLLFHQDCTIIEHQGISLFLVHETAHRTPVQGWYYRFEHAREYERGLDGRDDLFCPCELHYRLPPGQTVCLVASVDRPEEPDALGRQAEEASDLTGRLQRAARHFIVETESRATLIAGYPWFTDWGRDTMIALPGMCLHTGRVDLARRILADYGKQTFKGLIPNRFVDEGETPDYNTVDATLWYANAIYKTLEMEWNADFAAEMLGVLRGIYEWHKAGTLYGIKVDSADGLLTQGERGVQLTWMDAKVSDWVVTPRHGKPVEINGLWINMLRVLEWLSVRCDQDPTDFGEAAEKAEQSFDKKFFHEGRGHYADTVDPLDVSLRPNQVIAMSLPFGPAKGDRAKRALAKVTQELYTPHGLRTLGPREVAYRGRFEGILQQLDSAYHQGTAWPWLLGPYATALCRVNEDPQAARDALSAAEEMLNAYGLGGIAEVYDGDAPQRPNGCPWQAWSIGEILRALVEDCKEQPQPQPSMPQEPNS